MRRFARIIELPETQCLLQVVSDEEEESFKCNVTIDFDGVTATVGYGFATMEEAINCMDGFTDKNAVDFFQTTAKLIGD